MNTGARVRADENDRMNYSSVIMNRAILLLGRTAAPRVEVETQGNGNIGNKPGFFACFVSKKQ